jgi:cell wall-associated NlpC family hydrolase
MISRAERLELLFWAIALAMITGACASTGAVPRPFPTPGPRVPDTADGRAPETVADRPPEESARREEAGLTDVVRTALDLLGVPYKNGGQTPAGFDCSGFTQYVFALHGVVLPRGVSEQFRLGKSVAATEVVPGDLIFFATSGEGPSHVAIAVGSHSFVHAPSSKGVVRVEELGLSYWAQRLIGVRRMTAD